MLNVNVEQHEIAAKFYVHNKLEDAEFEIVEEKDLVQWFLYVRLTARIPISCDFQADSAQESFANLRKKVVSGGAAFRFNEKDVYILGGDSESISGVSSDSTIATLFPDDKKSEGVGQKKLTSSSFKDIVSSFFEKKKIFPSVVGLTMRILFFRK